MKSTGIFTYDIPKYNLHPLCYQKRQKPPPKTKVENPSTFNAPKGDDREN